MAGWLESFPGRKSKKSAAASAAAAAAAAGCGEGERGEVAWVESCGLSGGLLCEKEEGKKKGNGKTSYEAKIEE